MLGGRDVEEAALDDVGGLVSDVEAPVVDTVMTVVVGLPDIGGTPCENISSKPGFPKRVYRCERRDRTYRR